MITKQELQQILEQEFKRQFQAQNESIEKRFQSHDKKIEERFQSYDEKMEQRFQAQDEKWEKRLDKRFQAQDEKFDKKLELLKDKLAQMMVRNFYTKDEALRIFATKEDLKREITEGITILKVFIEENNSKVNAALEGHGLLVTKIDDHEKRIQKLEEEF